MKFQIVGLDQSRFSHLYGKDPEVLAEKGVMRVTVDGKPGFPCRVSLKDADIGEDVLLLNFEHQPASTPYRSSHAIFVREGTTAAVLGTNEVPEMLRIRLLSVRAFDGAGMLISADVCEGHRLQAMIKRMLSLEEVACLHLHNAKAGCFLARVVRA